jgi:hypothetical protein
MTISFESDRTIQTQSKHNEYYELTWPLLCQGIISLNFTPKDMFLENLSHFIGVHFLVNDRILTFYLYRHVWFGIALPDAPATFNPDVRPIGTGHFIHQGAHYCTGTGNDTARCQMHGNLNAGIGGCPG